MSLINVSVDIIFTMVRLWRTEQDCSTGGWNLNRKNIVFFLRVSQLNRILETGLYIYSPSSEATYRVSTLEYRNEGLNFVLMGESYVTTLHLSDITYK